MLKRRNDIKAVFASEKRCCGSVAVRFCQSASHRPGFVVIVQKKTHDAVGRNLIRRRISEILRVNQHRLRSGFDIALFAKRDVLDYDHAQLEGLIFRALAKGGLVRP